MYIPFVVFLPGYMRIIHSTITVDCATLLALQLHPSTTSATPQITSTERHAKWSRPGKHHRLIKNRPNRGYAVTTPVWRV